MDNSKVMLVGRVFYWNARLQGKTMLLAGPFLSAPEAEATADIVSPAFINERPEAGNASFGVMECNAPGPYPGHYNHLLTPKQIGGIIVLADGLEKKDIN